MEIIDRRAEELPDDGEYALVLTFFGFSIVSCMSSALSDPDGAGLGTLGLPPRALEQLARDAGFSQFRTPDFDDPANLYTRSERAGRRPGR